MHTFNYFLKFYGKKVHPFRTLLDQVRDALHPMNRIPPNATKLYASAMKRVEHLMLPLLKCVRKIGQGQLIRRQIANLLQFGCQMDAHLLFHAAVYLQLQSGHGGQEALRAARDTPLPSKGEPAAV